MEAKDNRKISEAQIKILTASKAATSNYDSNKSARVSHKKKARNGVLLSQK